MADRDELLRRKKVTQQNLAATTAAAAKFTPGSKRLRVLQMRADSLRAILERIEKLLDEVKE